MTERRRGTFLLFTAIALVIVSCGAFFADRYREGQRWRTEIASVGSCRFRSRPLEPEWLRTRLGSYAEPFQPIVEIRLGSHAYDSKTRRAREVEAGPWLERFANIETLRHLDLQSNRTVTDDDVAAFAASRPPALESLNLNRTDTTDRSLEALATIPTLHELHISLTFVTEEGIDRLRIARPDMKIVADPLTRRGLGGFRRRHNIDANSRVVHGLPVPDDLTVSEAEKLGRLPDSIWLRFFADVPWDVFQTLAKHTNVDSVAFDSSFSQQHIQAIAQTGRVKKLTVYREHLHDEALIDAICKIASLEQVLIVTTQSDFMLRDTIRKIASLEQVLTVSKQNSELRDAIRQRRPDVVVTFEQRNRLGWRFNFRYEPIVKPQK